MILILLRCYQILLHQLCPPEAQLIRYVKLCGVIIIFWFVQVVDPKAHFVESRAYRNIIYIDNDKLFLALSDLKKGDLMKALLLAAGRGTELVAIWGQASVWCLSRVWFDKIFS